MTDNDNDYLYDTLTKICKYISKAPRITEVCGEVLYKTPKIIEYTTLTPFGATNEASEIVSLARAKLRRGTSN